MNEQELNEIEARAEAATPGPWKGDRNDGTIKYRMMGGLDGQIEVLVVDHKNGHSGFYCGDGTQYEECEANEEFVKHARQDVPALVEEVRRLKADQKKFQVAVKTRIQELLKENIVLRDSELSKKLEEQQELIVATIRDVNKIVEENARLVAQVATAKEIVQAGIDIMDNDQLSQWRGVRSFLEQETDEYEGGAE